MVALPLLPSGAAGGWPRPRRRRRLAVTTASRRGAPVGPAARRSSRRRPSLRQPTASSGSARPPGVPFGRYHYTGALRPDGGRGARSLVPAAWFAMAAARPGRPPTPRSAGGRHPSTPRRARRRRAHGLGPLPRPADDGRGLLALGSGPGRYRGIPLTNYVGLARDRRWAVMAVLELLVPPPRASADRALVGVYGWMAVMETVGFAAVLPTTALVAAVGGAAMLPLGARWRLRGGRWIRWLTSSSSAAGSAGWPPPSACRAAGHARRPSSSAAPRSGGKLACAVRDGFTLRHRAVAADAAARLRRAVPRRRHAGSPPRSTCARLDPQFRYRWPDGIGLDARDDPEATGRRLRGVLARRRRRRWRRFDGPRRRASGTSASARSSPGR